MYCISISIYSTLYRSIPVILNNVTVTSRQPPRAKKSALARRAATKIRPRTRLILTHEAETICRAIFPPASRAVGAASSTSARNKRESKSLCLPNRGEGLRRRLYSARHRRSFVLEETPGISHRPGGGPFWPIGGCNGCCCRLLWREVRRASAAQQREMRNHQSSSSAKI